MLNRNHSFDYDSTLTQERNSNITYQKSSNRCLSTNIVIVRVDEEDYFFDNEKLALVIPNYSRFLKKDNKDTNSIVLPSWVERAYFDQYIVSVTKKVTNFDLNTSKKLIQISVYLNNPCLIKTIVNDSIIPNVTKHTCLKILLEYYENLSSHLSNEFLPLIQYCIEIASKNIYFLINNQSEELSILKEETIEEIIERYFELVSLNLNIDHSIIIRLLIKTRKLTDVFELLENERKKCISFFERIMCENVEPTIIWKIKNEDPQKGFYKESDEFPNENLNKVIISHYDHQKDVFNIALRINSVLTNKLETLSEETQSNTNDPSIIFSILSIVEIPEIGFKSNTNFNCVFNNNKIKILLCKIENFSKMFDLDFKTCKHLEFSMKIFFQINYNFSAILTHICKNFYEYYSLNSLSKISKNVFNIILKNKILNIRTEDEILFAVTNYINNKHSSEGLLDLFSSVNWKKISLEVLLEFIINESKLLLSSPSLNDLIIYEFNSRFKSQFKNKEELTRAKTPTTLLPKQAINKEEVQKPTEAQVMFPFTNDLIQNLIKIAQRYENQPKQFLYSHNVSSTNSNSTSHINSSLSKNNNPKAASRNSQGINNEDIKFPCSKQRINTSQESVDVTSNYNKKLSKRIEENLKNEGFSIDRSGYSTHRRLTSNLSFNNITQERRYKNESLVKNELLNNYNSLNCNLEITNIDISSPRADKTVNLQKKFTSKLNYKKENSIDIKQKFASKLINKMKKSTRTESKCDFTNNTNNNLQNYAQNNSAIKKLDKKTIKNEIFRNDQQSLVISRNSSIKMKKLNAKNSGLIFINSEEINTSSTKIKKNDITVSANVKFKQNTNFITKLQTLK